MPMKMRQISHESDHLRENSHTAWREESRVNDDMEIAARPLLHSVLPHHPWLGSTALVDSESLSS